MIALNIMLLALAQSVGAPRVARPDVEVVGPSQHNRVICRVIAASTSRIPGRRICRTQTEIEEARDRAQREAGRDVASTDRRTLEILENSSYGIWLRSNSVPAIGERDVRQERRGGD